MQRALRATLAGMAAMAQRIEKIEVKGLRDAGVEPQGNNMVHFNGRFKRTVETIRIGTERITRQFEQADMAPTLATADLFGAPQGWIFRAHAVFIVTMGARLLVGSEAFTVTAWACRHDILRAHLTLSGCVLLEQDSNLQGAAVAPPRSRHPLVMQRATPRKGEETPALAWGSVCHLFTIRQAARCAP
jgi:hypothetical protein